MKSLKPAGRLDPRRTKKAVKTNGIYITDPSASLDGQVKSITKLQKANTKTVKSTKFIPAKNPMPFDLDKAKAGVPMQFRNGTQCFFLCFEARLEKPLIVIYNNKETYSKKDKYEKISLHADGNNYGSGHENSSEYDVFMNIEGREVWFVLDFYYTSDMGGDFSRFYSEGEARNASTSDSLIIKHMIAKESKI